MRHSHAILLTAMMLGIGVAALADSNGSTVHGTIPEPIQRVDSIVNNFRKITVLTQATDRLDRLSREKVEALTWTLSHENDGRLSDLMQTFFDSDGHPLPTNIQLFLDRLGRPGLYQDGDRLAFEDVFEALYTARAQMPEDLRSRVENEVSNLRRIKSHSVTVSRPGSTTFTARSAAPSPWESYVSFLNRNYTRDQLLKEHASILPRR